MRVGSSDGRVAGGLLDAGAWTLQDAALRRLRSHAGFRRSAPGAVLVAVEMHRAPTDTPDGRACAGLRAGPLRLWARWGRQNRVWLGRGVVTVQRAAEERALGHPGAGVHGRSGP